MIITTTETIKGKKLFAPWAWREATPFAPVTLAGHHGVAAQHRRRRDAELLAYGTTVVVEDE